MKQIILLFIILLFTTKLYCQSSLNYYHQNPFNINIISISEFKINNSFLDNINNELQKYFLDTYGFVEYIEIDNYECIYELSSIDFEKYFFFIYKTDALFQFYYLIFVVTQNNLKEIKIINISEIKRRPIEKIPFPFDFPKQKE